MGRGFADDERIVEFQPSPIGVGLTPVSAVRHQRVVKSPLAAEFKSGARSNGRLGKTTIALNRGRTQDGKDQRAVSYIVSRHAAVQQSNAMRVITIIGPILRREL